MDESQFSQLGVSDSSDGRDRLSELTDSLIFVILSFLPITDVVRTTLLSKRWKDLWTTFPYLDFSLTDSNFIHKALAQWKGDKIFKFTLRFFFNVPPSRDLDSWLHFAIEKQVEELSINLTNVGGAFLFGRDSAYFVPQHLYSCSSFTKLSFISCKFKIDNIVQWNQLRSLTIQSMDSLSNDDLNRVLSGSPLLEELILCLRLISENLNIQSRSLKVLKIGQEAHSWLFGGTRLNEELRIWAPNLLTLEISGSLSANCWLDVPSLTNAVFNLRKCDNDINFEEYYEMFHEVFRSIRHVEKVTLSDWCIKFLLFGIKDKDMILPFSNAKFLKFYSAEGHKMLDVLEMFPELTTMIIVDRDQADEESPLLSSLLFSDVDEDKFEALSEKIHVAMVYACQSSAPKADFPSLSLLQLKMFEITWPISDPSIIAVIEFLLENAHNLEKMVLRLKMRGANQQTFVLAQDKVVSMPRSSPTAQLIVIKD